MIVPENGPACCIVCGAAPRPRVERADLRVVACPDCGLEWQSPFPPPAELAALYQDDYFARWGVRDDAGFERVRAMKQATYRPFLRALRAAAPEAKTLLDVGCAYGFLLGAAEAQGFEAFGVDLAPPVIERARREHGERVHAGPLDDLAFPGRRFDAVTLVDVLEHVPDPASFLDTVERRLAPGGVIAALLPNAASAMRRLLGARWPHYAREHLWTWTPESLSRFLRARGLEVVTLETGVRKTYTGDYLHAYARRLGGGFAPLFRLLGPLTVRVPTGEMIAIARRGSPARG